MLLLLRRLQPAVAQEHILQSAMREIDLDLRARLTLALLGKV
jgi:hypothetical protein